MARGVLAPLFADWTALASVIPLTVRAAPHSLHSIRALQPILTRSPVVLTCLVDIPRR